VKRTIATPALVGNALSVFLCAWLIFPGLPRLIASDAETGVIAVASLCNPAKLATLKTKRAANSRLLKALGWLEEGKWAGKIPSQTIEEAQKLRLGRAVPALRRI
jgi:hypothetical protein